MMNEHRRKRQILKVDHYDGQCIYSGRALYYELGGYLGGGAAGVVYEAFCARTKRHVAIKILNPVGYKLLPSSLLSRCVVAVRGKPLEPSNADDDDDDHDNHQEHDDLDAATPFVSSYHGHHGGNLTPGGSNRFAAVPAQMRLENVWWLIHPSTKQAVAAYEDPRTGALRELSLPQCITVWGHELQVDDFHDDVDRKFAQLEDAFQEVHVKNHTLRIPKIPKKFLKFALTRRTIHREIANMSGLGFHENVLRLEEALELVQDTKCTTFLVLELAAGGELFDRIKLDCGTDEDTARQYFQQLISGVAFCHSSGVCHRDLKPENLLLADNEEFSTLKIADFGLSAIFAMTEQGGDVQDGSRNASTVAAATIRRLRSVVGSPHYVAPEVLMDAGQGYDGAKADAWSIGVIVYAMLAGNLPFGKDLLKCLRYEKFKKWCYNTKYSDEDPVDDVAFPTWFFPAQFSLEVKSLITQLLYPDPSMRLSVEEAQRHAWVLGERLSRRANGINEEDPGTSPPTPSPLTQGGQVPCNAPGVREPAIAVVNVPQNVIEQEQQRWTQRSVGVPAALPGGYNRKNIPPSPQKAALHAQLMSSGYMPSVDETAPLPTGQTPVNSPRHEPECPTMVNPLQFDMEPLSLNDPAPAAPPVPANKTSEQLSDNDVDCECQRSPSFPLPTAPSIDPTLLQPPTQESTSSTQPRRRFTSPPLATGSRCSLLERHHYQHRRNSPPELFLSRFGKGFKFEAIQTACEEIHLEHFQSSRNLVTTPTDLALREQARDRQDAVYTNHVTALHSVPNTPLGGSTTTTASGPPSYQADLVARSTRFITTLPAQLVLTKLEAILSAYPTPLPTTSPRQLPSVVEQQRVAVDWDNYQLEVRYGDVLTCTMQVFLFQRGVYLVEFRRGQVEIFQFKRFYEDVREKLAHSMELPPRNASPRQGTHENDQETEESVGADDLSPRVFPRKRNKSIGVHAELLR